MKFLDKIKNRKWSKTLAAVAASGVLFFGANNVSAAPADDYDANFQFRQDYLSLAQDVRNFDQGITLFGTTFKIDFISQGQLLRDSSLRMGGNINWAYTDPKTKVTTNTNMPFFVTHLANQEDMMLYVQRNNKWSRFILPEVPVAFVDAVKSNDMSVLQDNLKAVKDVSIFRDTERQKIYNITLDGKYLSERLKAFQGKVDTTKLSRNEIAEQTKFFRNLQTALETTDINCTWTYDKDENATLTAVVDLTPLMRAYAESVLNEAAQGKVVLSEEERLLMETIGYYSEFHYSMNIRKNVDAKDITPPNAATKAPINNNVFQDFFNDMSTSVQR